MSQAVTRSRRWPKWLPIALASTLILLALGLVISLLTLTLGAVHGIEFSPQSFERRSYSFFELPLIGTQITAVQHDDVSKTTETFITTSKYITPPAGGPQDWHIVSGSRGVRGRRQGDASILMQYFDAQDSDEYHRWVKWSEDYPKLAKVFWPSVQRLAVNELYVFVPDLFDLAKAHDDPKKLQSALNQAVVERLLILARRLQERGEHAEAIQVLDDALALDPKNKELQRAKGTSKAATAGDAPSKPAAKSEAKKA